MDVKSRRLVVNRTIQSRDTKGATFFFFSSSANKLKQSAFPVKGFSIDGLINRQEFFTNMRLKNKSFNEDVINLLARKNLLDVVFENILP